MEEKKYSEGKIDNAWKDVANIEEYCNGLLEMMGNMLRTKSLPKMEELIKSEILKRGMMDEADADRGMLKFRAIFMEKLQLNLDFMDFELR